MKKKISNLINKDGMTITSKTLLAFSAVSLILKPVIIGEILTCFSLGNKEEVEHAYRTEVMTQKLSF